MNRNLLQLIVLSSLLWRIAGSSEAHARDSQVRVEQLLQTTHSWDGAEYTRYVTGRPQITILRISIPPNTALDWHEHPMISAGYVLPGQITLEIKGTRERKTLRAGEALAESVNTIHRGLYCLSASRISRVLCGYGGVAPQYQGQVTTGA
jgi:quercetin dioxygenase-like cupin family protein